MDSSENFIMEILLREIKSRRGMTLIEVMIAVGLFGLIAVGFTSLFTSHSRESKAVTEKLLSSEVKTAMLNVLMNDKYCSCIFDSQTFDTGPALAFSIGVSSLPTSFSPPPACSAGADYIVPPPGGLFGNTGVIVQSISVTGVSMQTPTYYIGNIEVKFDASSMIRAIRNISVPIAFSIGTTGTAATRPFVRCGAIAPSTSHFYYAVHSQTSTVPTCPLGWPAMWTGYSLIATAGSSDGGIQDLGSPGSCLKNFLSNPFVECKAGSCIQNTPNDYSYWLTTSDGASSNDTSNVSRCTVCDASHSALVLHSQDAMIPTCPVGMTSAWVGYSLRSILVSGGSSRPDLALDLNSPGSCLPNHRTMPFMECDIGAGSCAANTGGDYSYWLSNGSGAISRCNVCVAN